MRPETNYICLDENCYGNLLIVGGWGSDLDCKCNECGKLYRVCQDMDYRDGMWIDLSKITPLDKS